MRGVQLFSGGSHPILTETVCERLGTSPAKVDLGKFSNGETNVNVGVSVRNQDVYIIQSGSEKINDSVMELLIMISACKGGSAKSITAVMPYFPYSRQSKKKSHRGSITARMLANLLTVAGVDHVITLDLHASQMQGFFAKPVDNLFAEPFIARWIRNNVPGWREAVVVSKNAGGTKRVTSLADTLKLNFGIVTTDRRRPKPSATLADSTIFFEALDQDTTPLSKDQDPFIARTHTENHDTSQSEESQLDPNEIDSFSTLRPETPSGARRPSELEAVHEYTDVRVRGVITGRLVQGQLVDDDYPPSGPTSMPASGDATPGQQFNQDSAEAPSDPMADSIISNTSSLPGDHALGGSFDAGDSSDEDERSIGRSVEQEKTITLVGDVRDRTVFLVDDMIDKSGSWIVAAETVVKRGGAKKVYCIATHGLFGDSSLEQMEACESINYIVVTNTFPISPQVARKSRKLVVIDISSLLAESIRRHHYGESVSALFHLND